LAVNHRRKAIEVPLGVNLAIAGAGLTIAALPVFLVGGLAVQIRQELGFSETALGLAATVGFLSVTVTGPFGGRLVDRIGARSSVVLGAIFASVALFGIGFWARSWGQLAASMMVAGLAFAFIDPGLALLVSRAVPPERQGLAFGIKESSIPIATLAAGLAVPIIALSIGWRWAFLLGIIPLGVLGLLLPRIPNHLPERRLDESGGSYVVTARRALILMATGAAFGSIAASGMGVFLTESAVAMGLSPASAGWLLAAGSGAAIASRMGTGLYADRRREQQLGTAAFMLAIGGLCMLLVATGAAGMLVVGTIGAFAGGWGWTGLLFLTLIRANPEAPGALAGIGLAGLAVGNGLGPFLFGLVAQNVSFEIAWLGAAGSALVGALFLRLSRSGFAKAPKSLPVTIGVPRSDKGSRPGG